MTDETQTEKIVDPNTATVSNFIKFETGKRLFLKITNWRTVETSKTFEDKTKLVVVFRADVVASGEAQNLLNVHLQKKTMELSNISFRKQINLLLAPKKNTETVFLSVKRIGEGKSTTYDVEVVQ